MNYFSDDVLLQSILRRLIPAAQQSATFQRLSALGADAAGPLSALIEAAHQDGKWPRLDKFDRWGARKDEIVYCEEQKQARRLAFSHGCLPPVPLVERMAKAYLLNQNGEGGITCPLAMTDGLVQLLMDEGTDEQKKRWLPLATSIDTFPQFCAGQYVTEKQGGSSVSENETRAEPQADGTWKLTGLKWFCSNPGALWVTSAKPAGSDNVALFLVPRLRPDGSLNECHVLRLKDLSGTRGKATAEVEYRGAYAELIGRASHGMAILLRSVLRTSRIHTAGAGLGFSRRALVEARKYCDERLIGGKPVSSLGAARASLERMEALWASALLSFFTQLALIDAKDPAAEVTIPLLKIQLSRVGSAVVKEARLLLAGNASLRDFSILPRLSEDAIIQEIWEGTHPILAGHALRALRRPNSRKSFLELVRVPAAASGDAASEARWAATRLGELLDSLGAAEDDRASEGLRACNLAWRALSVSQLLKAQTDHAETGLDFAKLADALLVDAESVAA